MRDLTCLSAAALIVATGCDALTDGRYLGEPRLVVDGTVQSLSVAPSDDTRDTYVTIAWEYDRGQGPQQSPETATISNATFPSSFTLALYDEPRDEVLTERGKDSALGIGYIVVFDDDNGDGKMQGTFPGDEGPESVRGAAPGHAIIFARGVERLRMIAEAEGSIVNPEALQEGYNLARPVCHEELGKFDTAEVGYYDSFEILPMSEVAVVAADTIAVDDEGRLDCFGFW